MPGLWQRTETCKSSDLSWLVWCLMIKHYEKRKRSGCQKPCVVIPADYYAWRSLNCFTGDYSDVSNYLTMTLQPSSVICMCNRLPALIGVLLRGGEVCSQT